VTSRMKSTKPLTRCMEESGIGLDRLVAESGLEPRRVRAIVAGNYTPSPSERRLLAAALGFAVDEIAWGHAVPVEHMYGHGPQFGRSP
jgi:lambda repressor-like predicted transcriptional regulator